MRTLLKFEADWCGPCQAIKSIVQDVMASHMATQLKVINVDDDANLNLIQIHGVRAIPTLVLLEGERVVDTFQGSLSRDELTRFIEQ